MIRRVMRSSVTFVASSSALFFFNWVWSDWIRLFDSQPAHGDFEEKE